jgi:L-lysine exporter family protein LysE/ArgO
MFPLLKGACLTAGLIISLGPQNIELIRLGLLKQQVFMMATIFIFCDIILITMGAAGIGSIISVNPRLVTITNYISSIILYYLGYKNFKNLNVIASTQLEKSSQTTDIINKNIIYKGLILSFFNPLVIIETIVLVGGTSAQYPLPLRICFITGSIIVSIMWFYGVAYFTSRLSKVLLTPQTQRIVNGCAGTFLIIMATNLIFFGFS